MGALTALETVDPDAPLAEDGGLELPPGGCNALVPEPPADGVAPRGCDPSICEPLTYLASPRAFVRVGSLGDGPEVELDWQPVSSTTDAHAVQKALMPNRFIWTTPGLAVGMGSGRDDDGSPARYSTLRTVCQHQRINSRDRQVACTYRSHRPRCAGSLHETASGSRDSRWFEPHPDGACRRRSSRWNAWSFRAW